MAKERKNANDRLKGLSMSQYASILEESKLASATVLGKVYDIFGFYLLNNLDLCVFELLMGCTIKFLASCRAIAISYSAERQRQPLSRMRVSILRCMNYLLAAI